MHDILKHFLLDSPSVSCEKYGNGHIHNTYLVVTEKQTPYILQWINKGIFRDVPALMQNIVAVTEHLRTKVIPPLQVLTLIKTTQGEDYYTSPDDEYYRVYDFVQNSVCLERAQQASDFASSAVAFGQFQSMLSTFPAQTLHEIIPRFHDTPNRYSQLEQAIESDLAGRLQTVAPEIAFAMARKEEAGSLIALRDKGHLPLRVTHNDTKLNNVLLCETDKTPLCVIDLDTVMPGLVANDFGDSIRFGASTGTEDETDLSKISLSLPLFTCYTKGFLETCSAVLTDEEIKTLPMGAKLMTLECGIRFLADYLNGDVYFHTSHERHNLDRARTQFKLVQDMEEKWETMEGIVHQLSKELGRDLQ